MCAMVLSFILCAVRHSQAEAGREREGLSLFNYTRLRKKGVYALAVRRSVHKIITADGCLKTQKSFRRFYETLCGHGGAGPLSEHTIYLGGDNLTRGSSSLQIGTDVMKNVYPSDLPLPLMRALVVWD